MDIKFEIHLLFVNYKYSISLKYKSHNSSKHLKYCVTYVSHRTFMYHLYSIMLVIKQCFN